MFHTEFARMGPEPDPFQNDPFFANHRRMADMGFGGYAPAPFAGMTDPWGPRMSQGSQRTADPFGFGPGGLVGGFGAPNIGHDVAGSRRTGAFGGTSESTSTRIVNGRKETTYRKVDQDVSISGTARVSNSLLVSPRLQHLGVGGGGGGCSTSPK